MQEKGREFFGRGVRRRHVRSVPTTRMF